MENNLRVQMIIGFAKKVLQYPKGSKGYDPIDAVNLEDAINKYEKELKKDNEGKNKYLVALPCFHNAKGFSHQTILLYAGNIDDARHLAKILKPNSNIGDIKKVDY